MPKRPRFSASFRHAAAAAALIGGLGLALPEDPGHAASAHAAPTAIESSPFLGEWELDLTRMPENYGPPPRRVTFRFEALESGEWRTTVTITGADGSIRQAIGQYRRDGRAVPALGDTADGDSAAFSSPAPNVLVMSMASNRSSAGVRVYVISEDGSEMTESAANVNDQGAPFVRQFHFRRIG